MTPINTVHKLVGGLSWIPESTIWYWKIISKFHLIQLKPERSTLYTLPVASFNILGQLQNREDEKDDYDQNFSATMIQDILVFYICTALNSCSHQ